MKFDWLSLLSVKLRSDLRLSHMQNNLTTMIPSQSKIKTEQLRWKPTVTYFTWSWTNNYVMHWLAKWLTLVGLVPRCPPNFTGVRCQHILMNSHSQENPEALIAIGAGVAVLVCCLAGAIYCCMKKRYGARLILITEVCCMHQTPTGQSLQLFLCWWTLFIEAHSCVAISKIIQRLSPCL